MYILSNTPVLNSLIKINVTNSNLSVEVFDNNDKQTFNFSISSIQTTSMYGVRFILCRNDNGTTIYIHPISTTTSFGTTYFYDLSNETYSVTNSFLFEIITNMGFQNYDKNNTHCIINAFAWK